jgi:hypothetical protein
MQTLDDMKRDRGLLERTITEHTGTPMRGRECNCPFPEHPDKHPSAGIFEASNGTWMFKCHPCNFSGSFIDMEARLSGRDASDVIKSLNLDPDRKSKPAPPEKEHKVYQSLGDIEATFGMEIGGKWEYVDLEGNVDLVIYRLNIEGGGKRFSQVTPRNGGWVKTAKFDKNPLYNRAGIVNAKTILVVEGEKCADACIAAGIPTTTSPMGANSIHKADWGFIAGKNIYLWPDNDGVGPRGVCEGQEAMKNLARILEGHGCKVKTVDISRLNLPIKGDVFDFLEGIPHDERHKSIKAALCGAPTVGLMQELKDRADRISKGLLRPVEWPWRRFTEMTGFSIPGTVSLICGDGGSTKSFWLIEATSHWYEMGIPFAMYQLEDERAMHAYRAIAQRERRPELVDHVWGEGRGDEVAAILNKHSGFIEVLGKSLDGETKDNIDYEKLLKWTETRAKGGAKIIAIDPITMAAPEKDQWAADKNFTDKLKRIAREYSVSIVLVIHPKKGRKGSMTLDDLAGGSAFGRFAHAVVWLDNHGEPITSKVRDTFATMDRIHNRTMHIVKARNARGQGARLAFNFNHDLTFSEYGVILSKSAEKLQPSSFEQRAIANSQQMRQPAPPVEQYFDESDDQELF